MKKVSLWLSAIIIAIFLILSKTGLSQNLQTITPSVAIKEKSFQFKSFLNIYTQKKTFGEDGRDYYTTYINQFSFGLNERLNIGVDFWSKYSSSTSNKNFDFIGSFESNNFRSGVTGLGPSIKYQFKKREGIFKYLSLESTILLSLVNDPESRGVENSENTFLEYNRNLMINKILWDLKLSDKSNIFTQFSAWVSFPKKDSYRKNIFLETPLSIFYNYFPSKRLTLYSMLEYWGRQVEDISTDNSRSDNKLKLFNDFFVQTGLGIKYQIISGKLELETSYTRFILGSGARANATTINFGFRLIR